MAFTRLNFMVHQFESFDAPRAFPLGEIQISVIIPAFNASATIARAIASVRTQRCGGIEIIVIDDGSSDDTVEVVRALIGPGENIQLLRLAKNKGASAARNAGIAIARGAYLAFLDADDIWLPEKLAKQLAVMEADPTIALISCNSQMTSAEGKPLKEGHLNRPPIEGADAWKTLLAYNFLPTPTVLTRTSLVKYLGGFDESLAVGEDLDLWIKLGIGGKIAVLPEILIKYYDLSNSLMKRHGRETGTIVVPMLEKHISEQAAKLSKAEIRTMRGHRSFQIGCDLFFSGGYSACIPLFVNSALYGNRPIKSLSYVPRAILLEFGAYTTRALKLNK